MSIKIYEGFRMTGSLLENYRKLEGMRPWFQKASYNRYVRFIAIRATEKLDHSVRSGEELAKAPIWLAIEEFKNRQKDIKDTHHRDPAVDFEARVSLYPIANRSTLGIFWCDWFEWRHHFQTQPFIQEYGYWDNTDKPDNLSDNDWACREADWTRACLKTNMTFNSTGLEMDLMGGYAPYIRFLASETRKEDLLAMVPSDQHRIEHWLHATGNKSPTPDDLQSISQMLPPLTWDTLTERNTDAAATTTD